jgi:hypothetical protein
MKANGLIRAGFYALLASPAKQCVDIGDDSIAEDSLLG